MHFLSFIKNLSLSVTTLAVAGSLALFSVSERGCGAYLLQCGCKIASCELLGADCGLFHVPDIYGYDIAVEGVDYSEPQIKIQSSSTQAHLKFSMKVYSPLYLKMEICVMQDGVFLGSFKYGSPYDINRANYVYSGNFELDKYISIKHYNENGGNVYYILNSFEACKD